MAGIVKPRKVGPGSRIAVIAPAGPPRADRLQKGLAYFQKLGYEFQIYPQVKKRTGYLAGDDKSRAAAINDAFADDSIDGIFAARGGYGCLRLLPYIDFKVIKKNPKLMVGYSDLTVLLLAIYKECNLVTFHGPMLSIEFGKPLKKYTTEYFHKAIEQPKPLGRISIPSGYHVEKINGGNAVGTIIGGNLSLIARMIGTGFLPSFKDKLIFIEDTEEEPYRLDAYLSQLFQATDISKARGFVIGEMTKTEPKYGRKKSWTALEVIKDYFAGLNKPVIYNFPCGHGKEKITIPVGVKAFLDADKKLLEIREAGIV
jgi:muramoyltetrapeptide carboxypeptidase